MATAVLLSLAACDVADPIYNTPHPDHGTVTLTTDWSGIGTGLTAPDSYTVTAALKGSTAAYSTSLSGTTTLLAHPFTPGKYTLYACNTAEHIAVSGTTVTAGEAPGWFFTAVAEAQIEADKDYTLTAVMQQQVRQLTLIIEPTGGTTDRVERIEGHLSGVASTLDFADGTHATPVNVALQFSEIASGADAGKWMTTVRLLGTAGAQQKLNARLYFAGNSPGPVTLDSDLSTELATFNADKRMPLALGGRVVETPTGTNFGATITDWAPVSGSGTAD